MKVHEKYIRLHSIAEIAPDVQALIVEYRIGPDGLTDFPNEDEFAAVDKGYLWFTPKDLCGDSSIRFFGYRDVLHTAEDAVAEAKAYYETDPDGWDSGYVDNEQEPLP